MRVTRNLWRHFDKHFNLIYCTRKKGPAERNFGVLLSERLKNFILNEKLNQFFFYQAFLSRTLTTHRTAGEGRGPFFYSTLPLPPAHKHSGTYLQLCMWDDYHMFLIAPLVFTRLLRGEIYQLIELLFDWLMMWCWLLFVWLLLWI